MAQSLLAARHYLAGMIDGEGSVGSPRQRRRMLRITNTDLNLIRACEDCLTTLGVTFTTLRRSNRRTTQKGRKPAWDVHVYGRENFEVLQHLPLHSADKLRRIKFLANMDRPEAVTPARLHHLLVARRLTVTDVAWHCGVSRNKVYRLIKKYGLSRPQ